MAETEKKLKPDITTKTKAKAQDPDLKDDDLKAKDEAEDKRVNVCASLKIKEDKLDEFLAACDPCIRATNKEKGCIFYNCHQDLSDPTHIMFIEQWETLEDLETHLKTEHVQAIFAVVDKCKSGEPNIMKFSGPKVALNK